MYLLFDPVPHSAREASEPDLAMFLPGVTWDVVGIQPVPPEHGLRCVARGGARLSRNTGGFDLPLQSKGTRARVRPGCSLNVPVLSQGFLLCPRSSHIEVALPLPSCWAVSFPAKPNSLTGPCPCAIAWLQQKKL